MKRCTTCNRTYPDTASPFCAEDGTRLVDDTANAVPNYQQQQPAVPPQAQQQPNPYGAQQAYAAAQPKKKSRTGLYVGLGLGAVVVLGAVITVLIVGLWKSGVLGESTDNSSSVSKPSSSQSSTAFPPQVGSYKLERLVPEGEMKSTSTGPPLSIMKAADKTDGAFYTGPGGQKVGWGISLFSSANSAQSTANEAISKLRLGKQHRIVYDTPGAFMVAGVDSAAAIHTGGNSVQIFAGDDPETVRNFITAASALR